MLAAGAVECVWEGGLQATGGTQASLRLQPALAGRGSWATDPGSQAQMAAA